MENDLLLVHGVAALIGRTPAAVRALERAGRLAAFTRIGRNRVFHRDDVQELVRDRELRTGKTRTRTG